MKTFKTFVDESVIREQQKLEENYRTLAQKGIGAETKGSIKAGHGVDYYHPKTGDKHMGKIQSMSDTGYVVKDDKTGEKHSFDYFRKEEAEMEGEQIDERNKENADRRKMMDAERGAKFKAQGHPTPGPTSKQKDDKSHSKMIGRAIRKMSNEETELEEADFSKSQTTMAHTIGKHFKKKGIGDESKGGPFAVASAMVRDKPEAAKKAYSTIKAKMKNEEHQDMLMALYDELSEENQAMFEDMIEVNPEKLLSFAQAHFSSTEE